MPLVPPVVKSKTLKFPTIDNAEAVESVPAVGWVFPGPFNNLGSGFPLLVSFFVKSAALVVLPFDLPINVLIIVEPGSSLGCLKR